MHEDDNFSCGSKPLVLPESHSSWSNHQDPGNMTVVSSDGVTFYVPKSFMGRHCQLFHDMFSLPSDNNDPNHLACQPIFFTDAFCETSDSLSFFLFALTNDVFPRDKANLGQKPVKTFHASIELANKWDCPLVLRTLEGWLSRLAFERWGDDHFKPLEVFFLAAKGDMPNVARMVIELWDPVPVDEEQCQKYKTVAPHWHLHLPKITEGCEAWNPANWIHKGWSEVGLDYVFALCQCYREMDRQKRGQLFMQGLIEHSRRY